MSQSTETKSILLGFDLHHAPEKVWRALTDPDLLSRWLLPVIGFKLEPGSPFAFQAQPQPGWDGMVHCRHTEIEPLKKLSYAWVVGDIGIDTVVTFTLTPTDFGTHLAIEQNGFTPDQKRAFGGAQYGWKLMTERLLTLLDEIQMTPRKETHDH